MNIKKLGLYLLPIFLIIGTACEDEHFSDVPDVHFQTLPIYLDNPEYLNFSIGTSMALTEDADGDFIGGYAGIILYYKAEDIIYAYDLCCPLHIDNKETLELDGALAYCPTDSVYYPLQDGDPSIEIGGTTILRSYKVRKSGQTIMVYN